MDVEEQKVPWQLSITTKATQRAGTARAAGRHWPMHVEERVELLGISHAAAGDWEHPLGPHGEGLQGRVPWLHQLREEALHAAPAAHARHQLRQRAQHLPRRHHHGNVQVLLLQHAVSLQKQHRNQIIPHLFSGFSPLHCLLSLQMLLQNNRPKNWMVPQ